MPVKWTTYSSTFGEYNLSRMNQEETENTNRIITSADIETVI